MSASAGELYPSASEDLLSSSTDEQASTALNPVLCLLLQYSNVLTVKLTLSRKKTNKRLVSITKAKQRLKSDH